MRPELSEVLKLVSDNTLARQSELVAQGRAR